MPQPDEYDPEFDASDFTPIHDRMVESHTQWADAMYRIGPPPGTRLLVAIVTSELDECWLLAFDFTCHNLLTLFDKEVR